jgi:opacity protein-like surface antigen
LINSIQTTASSAVARRCPEVSERPGGGFFFFVLPCAPSRDRALRAVVCPLVARHGSLYATEPMRSTPARTTVIMFTAAVVAHAHAQSEPADVDTTLLERATLAVALDPAAEIAAPLPYARKGSRRWDLHTVGGVDLSDSNEKIFMLGAGVEYFVADRLSFDLYLDLLYANQDIQDAVGVRAGFGMTWHVLERDRWTAFVDIGIGLAFTDENIPPGGSSTNFTPRVGAGITTALARDDRLRLGVRWYHMSNGNAFRSNPGRDTVVGYAGISIPF